MTVIQQYHFDGWALVSAGKEFHKGEPLYLRLLDGLVVLSDKL